jgi:hypothetical protein
VAPEAGRKGKGGRSNERDATWARGRRARSEGAFSAPIENNSERRNPQEVEDMFVTSQIPDPMMHQLKDQEILVD